MIDTYQIDEYDKKYIASVIRRNVEHHKDVKDLETLSVLVFKGEHSFQEAAMLWKTRYPIFKFIIMDLNIMLFSRIKY